MVQRSTATLVLIIGIGAVTPLLAGSQAQATATAATSAAATSAACTKYVVTSTQPVEIYLDPEPTPLMEQGASPMPIGRVFCVYGNNSSNTRFMMTYYSCYGSSPCQGPFYGYVTNNSERVVPLNCAERKITRPATIYSSPNGHETLGIWPEGTTFCTFGSNVAGTRYQVYSYVHCDPYQCPRPAGVYSGWISSDPSYYVTTPPVAPSGLRARVETATSIRLSWTDNSTNEDGFEIINGVTSHRTDWPNGTAYFWQVAPGTYMCFKIRSYNTAGYSGYHPSAQMDWVCITTPQA